ncbi:hypothetical protein C8J56DRAFT_979332 [Mycena floridula]|nr:hypothetical protein C8J56DRAFT_979332 [Mycena floridula]
MPPKESSIDSGLSAEDSAISVPDSGDTGEGGKLKMIVQLLKKCLGVKDIASMRLSLPASLLEPVPNLEFSHYLDRPDIFSTINDYDEAFDRIMAVVRFTFTKDLKFVHGKVCKPYNSVLGEHFRTHWDFVPIEPSSEIELPPTNLTYTTAESSAPPSVVPPAVTISETDSVMSGHSSKSTRSGISSKPDMSPSTAATSPQQAPEDNLDGHMSSLSLGGSSMRVVYVTEQISHHPPVSVYYACCPSKSLELSGVDQITAKVSGTTLRVGPGAFNKGIFIKITGGHGEGEQYQITHPVASVNGILRGSFYVTVSESTIITCTGGKPGIKYRAILEYKEESWLGKAHFLIEGVIHTVHEGDKAHEEWTKVKHVPKSSVVAVLEGSWRSQIRWRRTEHFMSSVASSPSPSHATLPTPTLPTPSASKADLLRPINNDWIPLIDLSVLRAMPKVVRPIEKQLPHESRKLWEGVTTRLLNKEFSDATKEKVAIEQKQRDEAAERKKKGLEFVPRYFDLNIESGVPTLTAEGWKAVEEELKERS